MAYENVVALIQRETKKHYRIGYTVSDICCSIKRDHFDLLVDHHFGENELFDIVRAFMECNMDINPDQIR